MEIIFPPFTLITMHGMGPGCIYYFNLIQSMYLHTDIIQQGEGAPPEVHPLLLRRKGVSRTNHYQLVPRVSKELTDNIQEYANLCNAFEEFFFWVEEKVCVLQCYQWLTLSFNAIT
jgi:hypothetical protein